MPSKSATPQRLFGDAVRAYRKKLKLSQEELAHRAEINTTYMSEVERGIKTASIVTIVKIARGLGVTGRDLMSRAGL